MSNLEQQLVQVKQFLNHHSTKVRLSAVEIISGCSNDAQLHPFFTKLNIGNQLLDLCGDSNSEISRHACSALVNLTSNPNFSLNLLDSSPFNTILQQLRSHSLSLQRKELLIKMIVNLTQNTEGVSLLLQLDSSVQGLHVIRLIHMLKSVDIRKYDQIRAMHYIPYLLCNVTQNEIGRELVMEPQRNLIRFIVPFMDYNFDYHLVETQKTDKNTKKSKSSESGHISIGECYRIFHRGIWNLIKNCMFCLNDEPQLFLKQIQKSHGKNFMKQKESLKRMIRKYYLRIFIDLECGPLERNEIIFELINPLIGPLCEYPRKLRRRLKRKQMDNEDKMDCKEKDVNGDLNGDSNGNSKHQRMQLLLKRMAFDKLRFDDGEIRKVALECLHLFCAVNDDFGLHLEFPKMIDMLCLTDLLKEYEGWEVEEELIKISRDIRTTLKHKLKEIKERQSDNVDDGGTQQIGNEKPDHDKAQGDVEDVVKEEKESLESEEKEDGDGKEDTKMEVNEQSMGQQYVGVTSAVRQAFDKEQASALFDLAMK